MTRYRRACYVSRMLPGLVPSAPAATLALERRFPALTGRLPRRPLACLPTAVHQLTRLGLANLWIKRDDQTGLVYGGNKVRKLEWLLAEALARGHRTVLTTGALGSNHALATTIYARELGLRTELVLVPQPITAHVRRTLLLDHAYGATIHLASGVPAAVRGVIGRLLRGVATRDRPYFIPTGGSSPLGTLGFVNAGLELAEQVADGAVPEPAAIVAPLGSGGTVAGLVAGLKLAGLGTRVIAIRVSDVMAPPPARLARLARQALAQLARLGAGPLAVDVGADDFDVRGEWLGTGYGAVTVEAEEAQRRIAAREDLHLEATYGAKALAALFVIAREPAWRDRPLLFWHTYSAVDPGAALGRLPDWHTLPQPLHRFFTPR